MKLKKWIILSSLVVVVAISYYTIHELQKDTQLFASKTARDVIKQFEQGKYAEMQASVYHDHLLIINGDEKQEVRLAEKDFYLSLAPYIQDTHICFIHSLTGCIGELKNTDIHVTIVDENKQVIKDETMKTLNNGFVGIWLEKDKKYIITIEKDGLTSSEEIKTFKDDATCITAMQLQ